MTVVCMGILESHPCCSDFRCLVLTLSKGLGLQITWLQNNGNQTSEVRLVMRLIHGVLPAASLRCWVAFSHGVENHQMRFISWLSWRKKNQCSHTVCLQALNLCFLDALSMTLETVPRWKIFCMRLRGNMPNIMVSHYQRHAGFVWISTRWVISAWFVVRLAFVISKTAKFYWSIVFSLVKHRNVFTYCGGSVVVLSPSIFFWSKCWKQLT